MKVEYKDFIGIFSGVYPEGYCQHLINEFERLVEFGAGTNRQRGEGALKHHKNDLQVHLNLNGQSVTPFQNISATGVFFGGLQRCYDAYTEEFSILKDAQITGTHVKMQRTPPSGGYHNWHSEQGNGDHVNRGLVYMLYLNTLLPQEAGETEFLYQQRRIQPIENTMVIWPAAYTHAHRGNTVFGNNNKYIVTGWFCYE